MVTEIHINPQGRTVSDWAVKGTVNDVIKSETVLIELDKESNLKYYFANFLVLQCFRAELLKNPKLQTRFKFLSEGKEIVFDKNMRFKHYREITEPWKGVFELQDEFLEKILTT